MITYITASEYRLDLVLLDNYKPLYPNLSNIKENMHISNDLFDKNKLFNMNFVIYIHLSILFNLKDL